MAAPTLTELFGSSATRSGSTVTIDFANFTDLNSPTTATPAQLLAAYLAWIVETTAAQSENADWGIAASSFQDSFSFVTRGTAVQIQQTYSINAYFTNPISELDPDNVV